VREQIIVQYVGFAAKALVREYTFAVREPACEPREYTLAITNEAFVSHRARYQDAPEICSLRLHRELASNADRPLTSDLRITDIELADYQSARKQKPPRSFRKHGNN
jgi:hypothetical protein